MSVTDYRLSIVEQSPQDIITEFSKYVSATVISFFFAISLFTAAFPVNLMLLILRFTRPKES